MHLQISIGDDGAYKMKNMSDIFELPLLQSNYDSRKAIDASSMFSIYADNAEEIEYAAHAINMHDDLVSKLKQLVYCVENNSGHEPSLSCLHFAIDEAKRILEVVDEK
jgi:hypothetical protein